MNTAPDHTPELLTELAALAALLRGLPGSAQPLANTLRVQAMGHETFGRTDALDLFARHPLALSATPHVLSVPSALAVIDVTPEGRHVGVFADVVEGVLARVWVAGPVLGDAVAEAAVPVASDDFLTQHRTVCAGDLQDHPRLAKLAWPQVQASAAEALHGVRDPAAASSSQALLVRAFSSGDAFAALYTLRVQSASVPRHAHRRWALAVCRIGADGALLHRLLAVSEPWPVPAPVFF